ncbi:MAG: hypothetical protein IJV75_07125, partial [Alphaproteobacteria bacterium]|nr:hypothetical protein [Alphaproteobacteria bacterium]
MCQKIKQLKAYLKQMGQTYMPYLVHFIKRNKQGLLIGFVFLISLITFVFGHSHAIVGVVNMERVREQAEPYQEIEREREKYTQMWRVKFRAEQDVLDAEDKKLAEAQKKKSMKTYTTGKVVVNFHGGNNFLFGNVSFWLEYLPVGKVPEEH